MSGELQRQRGEVIERFINIEGILDAIICQRYFRRVTLPFLLEVLGDEYFNFGLKCNILQRAVKGIGQRRMDSLRRIARIRNYFAHRGMGITFEPGIPPADAECIVVDPRKITVGDYSEATLAGAVIDFDALYAEFMMIAGPLEEYLGQVLMDMGTRMAKAAPPNLASHSDGGPTDAVPPGRGPTQ